MDKQTQTADAKQERKSRPAEPMVMEATGELAGVATLPSGPLAAAGDGSIRAQSARLSDTCLHTIQRQTLAMQIGQIQGNHHLQRVVIALKRDDDEQLAPYQSNNGNGHRPLAGSKGGAGPVAIEASGILDVSGAPMAATGEISALDQTNSALNQPQGEVGSFTPIEHAAKNANTNTEAKAQEAVHNVDQTQLQEKKRELTAQANPDKNPAAENQAVIEQRAEQVAVKSDESAKPPTSSPAKDKSAIPTIAEGGTGAPATSAGGVTSTPAEAGGTSAPAALAAQQAADMAEQAAEAAPPDIPAAPPEVAIPQPVQPIDAASAPLPVDEGGNALAVNVAERAQALREQGHQFRMIAASARADAQKADTSLGTARQMIGQAETGLQTSSANMAARHKIVGQARAALSVSEQKAEMVTSHAPEIQSKAEQGKAETSPKASEARELVSKNDSKTPDDPEASGKSREQGQKLNQVSSDFATIDNTMGQAKDKAATLAQEGAQAKQLNEQTRGKIEQTEAKLGQAETHIQNLQEQNVQAQGQVDELSAKPAEMHTQAAALDEEGQALIAASTEMEAQLQDVEQNYRAEMQTVPPIEMASGASGGVIQRAGYEGRTSIDIGSYIPSVITARNDPSRQAQEEAQHRVDTRRRDQLARINQLGEGNFARAGAGERIGMALQLYVEDLFDGIRNINILQLGGHILQGIVDPRVSLGGVLSGLSMIASGGANLFSAEQWRQDPLGNALKSAADIVTGIAIVLGSISALALVIIGLMAALSFLTLGLAAPITVPVITICTTIAGWTLPATIVVGKWALLLQGIALIVNLVRAAAADTAQKMLQHSEQAAEDTGNVVNVVITMVGAKLGQRALRGVPALVERIQNLPLAPRPAPLPIPPELVPPVSATSGTTPPEPGATTTTAPPEPGATTTTAPPEPGATTTTAPPAPEATAEPSAATGATPVKPVRAPANRHTISKVNQRTWADDVNTMMDPSVDVPGDVAAINKGEGVLVRGNPKYSGQTTYEVNGRVYGVHENGTLYPIEGAGFHTLGRGAFKALGVFNKFGESPRATEILDAAGISPADRQAALDVYRLGRR